MDKLKLLLFFVVFMTVVSYGFSHDTGEGDFSFDWLNMELEVSGKGMITPSDYGNYIDWQYDATLRAQTNLFKNFIVSMNVLRLNAYNFARDILMKEPDKNEHIYNYLKEYTKRIIQYTDEGVIIKTRLPMFGENGFARFLLTAGEDRGSFPSYREYVYSVAFTGLVIDARELGRIPAIDPKIFDEDHQTVYSVELIDEGNFEKWGAVQYTDDPYYRGFEERVGENPYRIVALENDKLISTDIAISNEDAKTLLQDKISRESLVEGRVIIIIDTVLVEMF